MPSKAATASEYLAELPPERRRELAAVRAIIKKNLPKGYVETMQYGMVSYVVPLKLYPNGADAGVIHGAALEPALVRLDHLPTARRRALLAGSLALSAMWAFLVVKNTDYFTGTGSQSSQGVSEPLSAS